MKWQRKKRKAIAPEKLLLIKQGVIGVGITLVLALIGTGVWYGTRVPNLTIDTVTVVGGVTVDRELVRKQAAAALEGSYFKLVPKTFAWLYPQDEIASQISTIERVREVHVERISGTEVAVAFDEYVPYALWCEARGSTGCLFIDRNGYAFGKAPPLTGGSFVRYVDLAHEPELRAQAFPRDTVRATELFIESLERELGFFVTHVELDSAGDAFYTLAGGGELKATVTGDQQMTVENLATILQSDAFSHLAPGNFQYIDLRFGNKVFVNEEAPAPVGEGATSTATSSGDSSLGA